MLIDKTEARFEILQFLMIGLYFAIPSSKWFKTLKQKFYEQDLQLRLPITDSNSLHSNTDNNLSFIKLGHNTLLLWINHGSL